jgi:transcriptional regulator with XRE-family HTH domain
MMETFSTWLNNQLDTFGWTQAELARRAGLGEATLSRFISGTHRPGPDACLAIARAFGEPPENVFRLAGLLPPLPPAVQEEREAITILRRLPSQARDYALAILRALDGQPARRPAVGETPEPYHLPDDADVEAQILDEFRQLPEEWQMEALAEVRRLQHFSRLTVRFVGDEEERAFDQAQDEAPEALRG